jgi:hypothetical protein
MTAGGPRSIWAVFTATIVVGFAASLIGCASAGPLTTIAVSDVKSVAGTWKGVVYRSSFDPDYVALTIWEDGSYDVESAAKRSAGPREGQGRDQRGAPHPGGREGARRGNAAAQPPRQPIHEHRNHLGEGHMVSPLGSVLKVAVRLTGSP